MNVLPAHLELYNYLCPKNIPNKERISKYVEMALKAQHALTPADVLQWQYILEWCHTCISDKDKLSIAEKVLDRGLKSTNATEWQATAKVIMFCKTAPVTLLKHVDATPLNKWLFAKECLNLHWTTPAPDTRTCYELYTNSNSICDRIAKYLNETEKENYALNICKIELSDLLQKQTADQIYQTQTKTFQALDFFKSVHKFPNLKNLTTEIMDFLENRKAISSTNEFYERIGNVSNLAGTIYNNITEYTKEELHYKLIYVAVIAADTIKYFNNSTLTKQSSLENTVYKSTDLFNSIRNIKTYCTLKNIELDNIWDDFLEQVLTGKTLSLYRGARALYIIDPLFQTYHTDVSLLTFGGSSINKNKLIFWRMVNELSPTRMQEKIGDYLGTNSGHDRHIRSYFKKDVNTHLTEAATKLTNEPELLWLSSMFTALSEPDIFKTILTSWTLKNKDNPKFIHQLPYIICLDAYKNKSQSDLNISEYLIQKLNLLISTPVLWDLDIWTNKLLQTALITSYVQEININTTFESTSYIPDINHPVLKFLKHKFPNTEPRDIFLAEIVQHNDTGKALATTVGKIMWADNNFNIETYLSLDNLCNELDATKKQTQLEQRLFSLIFNKLSLQNIEKIDTPDFDFC